MAIMFSFVVRKLNTQSGRNVIHPLLIMSYLLQGIMQKQKSVIKCNKGKQLVLLPAFVPAGISACHQLSPMMQRGPWVTLPGALQQLWGHECQGRGVGRSLGPQSLMQQTRGTGMCGLCLCHREL